MVFYHFDFLWNNDLYWLYDVATTVFLFAKLLSIFIVCCADVGILPCSRFSYLFDNVIFGSLIGNLGRIVTAISGTQVVMVAVIVNLYMAGDWNTRGNKEIFPICRMRYLNGWVDYLWEITIPFLKMGFLVMMEILWILRVIWFLSILNVTLLTAVSLWLIRCGDWLYHAICSPCSLI